jgi:hypothetical protein
MSDRSRGAYYEKKLKEKLETEYGARVERALPRIVYVKGRVISTHHDFYNLFDLLAFFPIRVELAGRVIEPGEAVMVQVKFHGPETHGWSADVLKSMKEFPCRHMALWTYRRKDNKTTETVTWVI